MLNMPQIALEAFLPTQTRQRDPLPYYFSSLGVGSSVDTYLHVIMLHVYTSLMIFSEMIKHDANLEKPIDIFAIGFEEIVDLNASNIMKAR